MIPSYEQRFSRYEQSPEEVRELYTSTETGRIMGSVFQKYALEDARYADYAAIVGSVILGFYAKSRLPELFESELEIPRETADSIATDLADLLAPLPDKVRDPGERLELMPKGAKLGKEIEREDAQPISKDELVGSIKARRTMAGDMEAAKQKDSKNNAVEEEGGPARPAAAPDAAPHETPGEAPNDSEPKRTDAERQEEASPAGASVPRYAKPLTDPPRYDNDSST